MSSLPWHRLLSLILLPVVCGLITNHSASINDTNAIIRGGAGWTTGPPENQCGPWTQEIGDYATFNFTGIAVYVYGDVMANPAAIAATLDGSNVVPEPDIPNVQCNELIFYQTALNNTAYTLNLTFVGPVASNAIKIGSITYTIDDTPAPSTSSSGSSPPIPTSSNSSSNGSSPPIPVHATNTPAIVGGSVGGSVGGILLLLSLLFLYRYEIACWLSSLLFFPPWCWLFFTYRRFTFQADKSLPAVEITLFLSKHKVLRDDRPDERERLVAWRVFKIGGSRKDFDVRCPCIRGTGEVKLGFGTIRDKDNKITCVTGQVAPAIWDGMTWERAPKGHLIARNLSETPEGIAIGTIQDSDSKLEPFLWIQKINHEETYRYDERANPEFYLHAVVTHGYSDGYYNSDLVSKFEGDMLTSPAIKVSDLSPVWKPLALNVWSLMIALPFFKLSRWYISRRDDRYELDIKGRVGRSQGGGGVHQENTRLIGSEGADQETVEMQSIVNQNVV